MWQDLRFAVRALTRRRRLIAAALLTLALGIAAATGIFNVVDSVLVRALPYLVIGQENMACGLRVFGRTSSKVDAQRVAD